MEYIFLLDITDKILQVNEDDIVEANAYLQGIADRYGVTEVQSPISHTVKRLGVVYACYVRAVASVGTDASVTFDGSRHDDVFAQKAEFYGKELKRLEQSVTKADFDGVGKTSRTVVNLWRS